MSHEDRAEANQAVLGGAYDPRPVECRMLDDGELPEGLEVPGIDDELRYVVVVLFYPHAAAAPSPIEHLLDHINGDAQEVLRPVHVSSEVEDEGIYLTLVYRTTIHFEHARMIRDRKPIVGRIDLE